MSLCTQITDAAFTHLRNMRKLSMTDCVQPTITNAVFEHLQHVVDLNIRGCTQLSTTTDAFAAFKRGKGVCL